MAPATLCGCALGSTTASRSPVGCYAIKVVPGQMAASRLIHVLLKPLKGKKICVGLGCLGVGHFYALGSTTASRSPVGCYAIIVVPGQMAASRLIHLLLKTELGLGCLGAVPEGPRRLRLSSECGMSLNPIKSSLFGYYPDGYTLMATTLVLLP